MPTPRTGRDYVLESLPDLKMGSVHTTSSALHPISFVGWLSQWPGFKGRVIRTFNDLGWNTAPIDYLRDQGPHLHKQEHTQVGDEHDVQARISDRISQPLSMVAKDQFLNFLFGGPKSVPTSYTKIPDFVIIDGLGNTIAVVGEVKTPWVEKHRLRGRVWDAMYGNNALLRKSLGQIAQYMRDLGLKYGVLTNYEETIFLRQVVSRGQLGLEYSPVIEHSATYDQQRGKVTVRQAFLHLATLALDDSQFSTVGANIQKWTERMG